MVSPEMQNKLEKDLKPAVTSFMADGEESSSSDREPISRVEGGNQHPAYLSGNSSNSSQAMSGPVSGGGQVSLMFKSSNPYLLHSRLPNPPTLIEWSGMRFLIMDAPSEGNLHLYLKEMEQAGVVDVVRVCESTYDKGFLESQGIKVYDWVFPDGEGPPENVIKDWLNLVERRFKRLRDQVNGRPVCIGTHCVAGLGRAPVLVAIALIEEGMAPLDAVLFIREKRRGAINNKQLKFLENYKRRSKSPSGPSNSQDKCIIM